MNPIHLNTHPREILLRASSTRSFLEQCCTLSPLSPRALARVLSLPVSERSHQSVQWQVRQLCISHPAHFGRQAWALPQPQCSEPIEYPPSFLSPPPAGLNIGMTQFGPEGCKLYFAGCLQVGFPVFMDFGGLTAFPIDLSSLQVTYLGNWLPQYSGFAANSLFFKLPLILGFR